MFVLDGWVNRWDARDTNTLASWINRGNGGYVRHYVIDFGEALGLVQGNDRLARRYGYSQYLDVQHVTEDAIGLGLVRRPWDSVEPGPASHVLGFYEVEPFEPDQWHPVFWNGALERMTERDAAWMARIVARFDRRDLQALASLGRYTDPMVERELVRVMAGRRRAILERYLTRLSPLADPIVDENLVCMTDLAVFSRLRWPQDRIYDAHAYGGANGRTALGRLPMMRRGERVCAVLPGASEGYLIVDVASRTREGERNYPARLHLALAGSSFRVVGLERPASRAAP
jgi:hypothetical protein